MWPPSSSVCSIKASANTAENAGFANKNSAAIKKRKEKKEKKKKRKKERKKINLNLNNNKNNNSSFFFKHFFLRVNFFDDENNSWGMREEMFYI